MTAPSSASRTPGDTGAPVRWQRRKQRTRTAIEETSLRLFADKGFDETTVDDLAAAAGIGRRTFFRYYPSKNDVVFGDYDARTEVLRAALASADADTHPVEMVRLALRATNDYAPDEYVSLAIRIWLLTSVRSLQAHAAWRYSAWEELIIEHVLARVGTHHRLYACGLAKTSIAAMWAAYTVWLNDGAGPNLESLIDEAFTRLTTGFANLPNESPEPPGDHPGVANPPDAGPSPAAPSDAGPRSHPGAPRASAGEHPRPARAGDRIPPASLPDPTGDRVSPASLPDAAGDGV